MAFMSRVAFLVTLSVVSSSIACVAVRRNANGDRVGGGNSILASINGISDTDRKLLKDPRYLLLCGATDSFQGAVDNPDNPTVIRFEITTLLTPEAKASCGLRIVAQAPTTEDLAKFEFKWFADPAAVETDPERIYYASTRDAVAADGKLVVKLYKLYSRIDRSEPLFLQPVIVHFPDADTLPTSGQVSANLECSGVDTASTQGLIPSTDVTKKNQATMTFGLAVERYKGKTCQRLVLAISGEVKYEATLTTAVLDAGPTPGSIARALGPIELVKATAGTIVVDPQDGEDCLQFDQRLSKCLDKRDPITLPRSQNFWVALVSGKDSAGGKVEMMVSGPAGLGLDTLIEHKQISQAQLKADLAVDASARKFTYYRAQARTDILNAVFDSRVVAPNFLADSKKTAAELSGIKIYSIDDVWVHGMNLVTEEKLNQKTSARWLAMVKATKDSQSAEFIVTGGADYFYSDLRRGGTNERPAFFDFEAVKKDRNTVGTVGETDYYDVYATVKGALAPAGCVTPKDYYLEGMSSKNGSEFPPVVPGNGGVDDLLEKCEVRNFGTDFDTFKIEATLYEWGWAKI